MLPVNDKNLALRWLHALHAHRRAGRACLFSATAFRFSFAAAVLLLGLLAVGCGGKKHAVKTPPPPEIKQPEAAPEPAVHERIPRPSAPQAEEHKHPPLRDAHGEILDFDPSMPPIWSTTGYASWYGTPYKGRQAASGEIYDENAMTAAHRTLPLQSILKVTNLKTGSWALLRVNDRGPFVTDRSIDLSVAAAKALDIWRPGTAPVRIDVLYAPKPIEKGGRWCVQIGAIGHQGEALRLKGEILRLFPAAKVLTFAGPTGYWLRVRVEGDDKILAQNVTHAVKTDEGAVFLLRLD
jgi:rare lipoprotein A